MDSQVQFSQWRARWYFLCLSFTLSNALFTEPSIATPDPDFSFIKPADTIMVEVKEVLNPQIENFVVLCLTGTAATIIIKAIMGGR